MRLSGQTTSKGKDDLLQWRKMTLTIVAAMTGEIRGMSQSMRLTVLLVLNSTLLTKLDECYMLEI